MRFKNFNQVCLIRETCKNVQSRGGAPGLELRTTDLKHPVPGVGGFRDQGWEAPV